MSTDINIAVSGIPRGNQFPGADGNWLNDKHRRRILAIDARIRLHEIPAHEVTGVGDFEILLAEGGNRRHYPGELDWHDYQAFFTTALKWVQICSTGFSDNITKSIISGEVILTNAPGLHTIPIAESVMATMLEHAKNLHRRRVLQAQHCWKTLNNRELRDASVLILGLGNIGAEVARLCKAFGLRVLGTRRQMLPVAHVDEIFPVSALAQFLPRADYIVVALPHTPLTEKLLDKAAFAVMRPHVWLINIGRGPVVDEQELRTALVENRIGGACVDAFNQEPLPADHPFWDLENLLLIPHDSHSSPRIGDRMVDLFCDNLTRYVAGRELQHRCDPGRGY